MKPVKVGILGLGTVGGGTVNVLKRNAHEISRRAGREIIITRASARDLTRDRICDTQDLALSTDPYDIINDPEIEIILELIGGTSLAKELVLQAIANGKHIVTANKALIALHGNEIFAAASKANVMVAYEAAVAGGIPIIKAIREGLSGNQIEWLAGIINGTGNFILTEMRDKGRDFADVLTEAQELGYAEADPTFDVEGIDAGHKLMILASIAFGIPLQFDNVFTEGITKITRTDVEYAGELGYRIKHLGIARKTAKGIELRVHPTLIPERRLIANVDGVINAILVQADAVGSTLYYGAGAGAEATASAVVADVIDVVRALTLDVENRVPYLGFQENAIIDLPILPREEIETTYYLRLTVDDKPGALADISNILAQQNISIEALIQKEPQHGEPRIPIIMLTQKTIEKEMDAAIAAIENLASVTGQVTRIRLETLG
ncbi:homoserine dehydrogenase [Bathymodiolus japonicus methanotrophic gill symbiont]|uniref:homoserine dehydrogenase n=1 Tax=Bathymodiolus japonicus methanotrophic gill symbiont TaxID=113269 RepID=UPI001B4065DE|nr:homoserine dehydrogenase [Bathymodiolus japonicus methanotrophic gill symbiont]GFO71309.1 homoserine dehydrogenase [Bathymodiolus japonicus methanotrophic gill symbiont]